MLLHVKIAIQTQALGVLSRRVLNTDEEESKQLSPLEQARAALQYKPVEKILSFQKNTPPNWYFFKKKASNNTVIVKNETSKLFLNENIQQFYSLFFLRLAKKAVKLLRLRLVSFRIECYARSIQIFIDNI